MIGKESGWCRTRTVQQRKRMVDLERGQVIKKWDRMVKKEDNSVVQTCQDIWKTKVCTDDPGSGC